MTRLDSVAVADPISGISTALDLHSMRLAHGFHFRVLQDPNGDSLFELVDEKVLELVNNLGIYEEEVPMEALNIRHK